MAYVPLGILIVGTPPFVMWLLDGAPTLLKAYALVGWLVLSGVAGWTAVGRMLGKH